MKIYNTLTHKKEELTEKKIGIYVCGPTVYDEPHIGHARSAYIFDFIVKYLKFKGAKITFVRNVTDVDDKIIEKARAQEPKSRAQRSEASPKGTRAQVNLISATKEIAQKYLKAYHEDMNLLGLDKPDYEPKATETIRDMIKFIESLIKRKYAYARDGNVYFDVRKFKYYGKLSGQSLDEMEEGARVAVDKNKRDPLDFALWKASKEDEPSWPSPWGRGRPGWHIECSVMSTKYLKDNFIIHGGGLDLVFPHHENEIAQTVSCGKKCAKYWIHNGLLTIKGQKMSKSLGNFISIRDFKEKYNDMDLLKLLFLTSHYRHPVDYTEEKIGEMKRAKERMNIFFNSLQNAKSQKSKVKSQKYKLKVKSIEEKFIEAMDDDFNTPLALSAIFELVALGNICISENDIASAKKIKNSIKKLISIFGLTLKEEKIKLDTDIKAMIEERNKARKDKDFNRADDIRERLLAQGIILEDTKEGTVWRRKI